MKRNYEKLSIAAHKKARGKISVESRLPIKNKDDLSLAYTPGVAGPSREIVRDKKLAYDLTAAKNSVAIISDGSAVLGLGDIGPEAALPVMEGKAALFKRFAGIDAFPIVLSVREPDEIIAAIKAIAPTFGGINLEDISAPRCFEIEERLKKELDIPVMHDDQHGTAVVVLAGLINALKAAGKKAGDVSIVINGAGAAGIAISKLLHSYGFSDITICDSQGIISRARPGLSGAKKELAKITNKKNLSGSLADAIAGADALIGVSKGNLLKAEDIRNMARNPIIFALANPVPEITPEEARKGGALIFASGRSDLPNQINNVLAYPGIFKGVIESRSKNISEKMKISAAKAIAGTIKKPFPEKIVPNPFEKGLADKVAKAVKKSL